MPAKRSLARTRQTKLNFSPASNPSPQTTKPTFVISSDSDDAVSPSRLAKRQKFEQETERGMKLGMPSTPNKRGMFDSSDEEVVISSGSETSEGYGESRIAPPKKVVKKGHKKAVSHSEAEAQPKHKKIRAARKSSTHPKEGTSDQSGGDESTATLQKGMRKQHRLSEILDEEEVRSKRKKRDSSRKTSVDRPEYESEDEAVRVPRKDMRKRTKRKEDSEAQEAPQSTRTSRRAQRKVPVLAGTSEEDSEDEVLATPKKVSRKRKRSTTESSDGEVSRGKKRNSRAKRRASTSESDSNAEEPDRASDDEADELKEDLAFLQSSPLGLGSTQNKAKSAREKALEAMKKRRAVNSDPPSSAARKKPVIVDSESESELEIIAEEPDGVSQEDESEDSNHDEYSTTAHEVLYGNDEDESFINDDDAPIGVPVEHALPLQFSSLSNAKPRDLFKYAIDWMVQKKINPAFSSEDEIYEMTFRKLDDEVNALAGSKYHSSVWTNDFTRAIKARPEIIINDIDPRTRAIMEPYCEACNRRSHPATFELSFTGKPYHKGSLEPLASNSSDSDTDTETDSDSSNSSSIGSEEALNGEKPTYDAQGERIPPESKIFTLGSTCKANAQVAHTLYHWKYHLNSWVLDYLVRQGHCSSEQLVRRDKLSQRKRQKLANKIVDKMESTGEVKKLYRQYKDQVNWALEADNEYRKGWGRRA